MNSHKDATNAQIAEPIKKCLSSAPSRLCEKSKLNPHKMWCSYNYCFVNNKNKIIYLPGFILFTYMVYYTLSNKCLLYSYLITNLYIYSGRYWYLLIYTFYNLHVYIVGNGGISVLYAEYSKFINGYIQYIDFCLEIIYRYPINNILEI